MGAYDCDNYNDLMARIDDIKKRNKVTNSPTQMSGTSDAEFWKKRALEYSKTCCDLLARLSNGTKVDSIQLNENGISFHISTQPEQKKGTWIEFDSDNDKYDEIKCNRCEKIFTVDAYRWTDIGFTKDDLKFCPHCGADMRGDEQDG